MSPILCLVAIRRRTLVPLADLGAGAHLHQSQVRRQVQSMHQAVAIVEALRQIARQTASAMLADVLDAPGCRADPAQQESVGLRHLARDGGRPEVVRLGQFMVFFTQVFEGLLETPGLRSSSFTILVERTEFGRLRILPLPLFFSAKLLELLLGLPVGFPELGELSMFRLDLLFELALALEGLGVRGV